MPPSGQFFVLPTPPPRPHVPQALPSCPPMPPMARLSALPPPPPPSFPSQGEQLRRATPMHDSWGSTQLSPNPHFSLGPLVTAVERTTGLGQYPDKLLTQVAHSFFSHLCEVLSGPVALELVHKTLSCALDSVQLHGTPWSGVAFAESTVKVVTTHCQTKHHIWSRPNHPRASSLKSPVTSVERRTAMNMELNSLMVQRCIPLMDQKT